MSFAVDMLADSLGVGRNALRAVLRVECGSDDPRRWFDSEGRPWIRVEAHLVLRGHTPSDGDGLRDTGAKDWLGHEMRLDGEWRPYHGAAPGIRPDEYDAFDVAVSMVGLDRACQCTSFGAAQVLGVWKTLGYVSPETLIASVKTPDGQLGLLRRYFEFVKPQALKALRDLDWLAFARSYNGPGKAADYAAKLSHAHFVLGGSAHAP